MNNLYHIVNALAPATDAFSGTVHSQAVNMADWDHCSFLLINGVGTTGTSLITVEACSDHTGANPVAIPFYYQACVIGDTFGAIVKQPVAATGFTTAAVSNKMYKVEVDSDMLAASGYSYVRITAVEQVSNPVLGGIVAVLTQGRFDSEVPASAIV